MSTTTDSTQRMIFLALPFVFVTFVIRFPAGLLVYWITTNIWTIVQQAIIRKRLGPAAPGRGRRRRPAAGCSAGSSGLGGGGGGGEPPTPASGGPKPKAPRAAAKEAASAGAEPKGRPASRAARAAT